MQTSTEQLTRYSTGTLEEILDNTEGVVPTGTVSQKIMSICKNKIRWVLLLDIVLASSVFILLGILEFCTLPHQQIGFYCNDTKISFKYMGDTISFHFLIIGSIVLPIILMLIVEYSCHDADSYDIATGCAGSRLRQIWTWYMQYSIGLVTLTFVLDIMKVLIGEPRPHFLDTCRPRENENCTNQYFGKYTCTNTVDSEWFVADSSKSFPSGHSALSMYTSILMVWYVQTRLPDRTLLLKPWLQCVMCLWTVTCSLTRISDNRHHWWDVLAGDILGVAFGVLTVTVLCHRFRLGENASQGRNEPVENGQINYNGKRHQSVKKLLNDPCIDLPEGRELKNIATSWKE